VEKLIMGEWLVETPTMVMGIDECGFEIHGYKFSIVVRDVENKFWTHNHLFMYRDDAERFLSRIRRAIRFNPDYWYEGTLWDEYRRPMTCQEELDYLNECYE
jgi:hypothetical protein